MNTLINRLQNFKGNKQKKLVNLNTSLSRVIRLVYNKSNSKLPIKNLEVYANKIELEQLEEKKLIKQ